MDTLVIIAIAIIIWVGFSEQPMKWLKLKKEERNRAEKERRRVRKDG